MYYKRFLTLCGLVQLLCGIASIVLFLLEWKVFGLLIPIYAVGVVHVFCGAWCLVEIYRKASITAGLYTSGACVSAAALAVAITLVAVSAVDLKNVSVFAQYYRTPTTDNLVSNVDHVQVLIGFAYAYLMIGMLSMCAASTQFIVCIIRLVKNTDGVQLPTRIIESRLMAQAENGAPYSKMTDDDETRV